MENIIMFIVGIEFLVIGYVIGIRHKINLVHSYHYKRVLETDKPIFCKGVGLGLGLIGIGMMLFPVINLIAGESVAFICTGILAALGLIITLAIIIKYNKGLF